MDLEEQNEASQEDHLPADATGTSVTPGDTETLQFSLSTQ